MRVFFLPSAQRDGDRGWIEGSDLHHLTNVLRKQPGDKITLTDGRGNLLYAVLESIRKDKAEVRIEASESVSERSIAVRLYLAIPRGDGFESALERVVELGVNEIVPLITERVSMRFDSAQAEKKLIRYRKVALETAKKVGRTTMPEVFPMMHIEDIQTLLKPDSLKLAAWELEREIGLKKVFEKGIISRYFEVVIGPEGGFSHREIGMLKEIGFQTVSLGNRVMRVETATVAMVANLYFIAED